MDDWQTIIVLGAADNTYVQHLAVAFVSLLANLSAGWKAYFYVAEAELTPENRQRLTLSIRRNGGEIEFLRVGKEEFDDLFIAKGRHITQAGYYRVVMPDLLSHLPAKYALYLDCDVIVRDDVSQLMQTELQECPIGAVEDLGGSFRLADLDMMPGTAYFNSGVMLINLPAWREFGVSARVFRFLRDNRHRLYFHDQDGLNAILQGKWLPLHPKWNAQRNMFEKFAVSPDKETLFREGAQNPSIVHFTGSSKPWQYDNAHPHKKEYYRYLALTEWKGFKPQAGFERMLKRWARLLLPASMQSVLRKWIPIYMQRSKIGGR